MPTRQSPAPKMAKGNACAYLYLQALFGVLRASSHSSARWPVRPWLSWNLYVHKVPLLLLQDPASHLRFIPAEIQKRLDVTTSLVPIQLCKVMQPIQCSLFSFAEHLMKKNA
jgi:hypothetical protein